VRREERGERRQERGDKEERGERRERGESWRVTSGRPDPVVFDEVLEGHGGALPHLRIRDFRGQQAQEQDGEPRLPGSYTSCLFSST